MIDYLILGGGLSGCVLASRLKEYNSSLNITLVEAGPDEHEHPLISEPMGTMQLNNSSFQYSMRTVPQKHCGGREVYCPGGKLLSGSSSVNYAAWTRGDRADYDLFGRLVGDKRWSYDGLLPYFKKTETHHDANADPDQHGFEGPIHTTPANTRTYPLTEKLRPAWLKIGLQPNKDHNAGDNKGMAPHIENWRAGKRQAAGKAYGLQGIDVITNTVVKRVILADGSSGRKKAVAAELTSGQILKTNKEVIVCCGAIRTPQLLMLSGIGPADELKKHDIQQLVDSPEVGRNLSDHGAVTQFYKIRNPELGLCAPHPAFNHPSYADGFPTDYVITESASAAAIKEAILADEGSVDDHHPHLHPPRSHYELIPMYAPTETPLTDMNIPFDGSVISIGIINCLPTSRGTVSLGTADPAADPLVDPNYWSTNVDRAIIRAALRRNMSAFETLEANAVVVGEVPPKGYPQLTSESTDEEIDARVRRCGSAFFHTAGTASMGKVVDTECRVFGMDALRVVDMSVLPTPVSAHYMVAAYAVAEQMAAIIAEKA